MSTRDLTPRQLLILRQVVATYISTGQPVGSKALVEAGGVDASSSTVRYELAELESLGLLGHPHTSAGRVPTDSGYQLYAEQLLDEPLGAVALPVDLSPVRSEIDTALRTTTEMLSHVSSLLALVSAPPLETAEVRHVEVLLLQPRVVLVVVITSNGGVTKKLFPFPFAVDGQLAQWAGEFLNEQLSGVGVGSRVLQQRIDEPGLSPTEREFLDVLRPVFTELQGASEQTLYIGGAARLLEEMQLSDPREINDLVRVLEERVGLLELLRGALDQQRLYVRVGAENPMPHMRSLSMVAANYGLPNRNLGTVSLVGPMRMDYIAAIRAVRGAAHLLSEFVTDGYEE
ncbi:MAG TPA: heat-inducible transcriptional repressor HrcA [Gaiellales bacterium]|jgi:heat-inducible transcriptional repressor|nr:heat-inducible transcriptional repressor HrcA [Gaiellales bacterium]